MSVIKKLRTTIIDHNPATEEIVGATKVFERFMVDEDDQEEHKIEGNYTEGVDVADIPTIWGGTTDVHVAQLQRTEELLQRERDQWARAEAVYKTTIQTCEEQLRNSEAEISELKGRLQKIGELLVGAAKVLGA